jgi:hypothetical protein
MNKEPMMIANPLVIMFKSDGKVTCHIHPQDMSYEEYGLLICDLVRHVSNAFKVSEDDVWKWVDMERHNHTTDITQAS